jgi:hypothetical protein
MKADNVKFAEFYMASTPSADERARRTAAIIKVVLFVALGLIAAPVAFLAIKGLIGLIVAAFIAFTAITIAPVLGDTAANWKLKALKDEAARNPVETLQRELLRRQTLLDEQKPKIERFETKILNFEGKLAGFKRQYPEEAPRFERTLNSMRQLLTLRKERYQEAKTNLLHFESETEKARAIWEMGQAAKDASEGGMTEDDFYAKLKTDTSIEAIEETMNESFARLESSLLESKEPTLPLTAKRQLTDK